MNVRTAYQITNLKAAFAKLSEFAKADHSSEVVRAGVIQAFEFSFELFWKVFQSIAIEQGLSAASPKSALKAAFKISLITDETAWLDMLKDRNLTVHTYKEALAREIYDRIISRYLGSMAQTLRSVAAYASSDP